MVVVRVRLPDVPETVMIVFFTAALDAHVRVKILVVVAPAGLKDAVTPGGSPDAERFTAPEKPLRGFTVILIVPLAPWRTWIDAAADKVKSGELAPPTRSLIVLWPVGLPQ